MYSTASKNVIGGPCQSQASITKR